MNPVIRKFEYKDINEVYNIGIKVHEFAANDEANHKFWPKNTLENFVNHGFSFVIECENKLVGFLLAAYQPVTGKLTWENMHITSEYRKQGLAEECFKKSWELAQKHGAIIAEGIVESTNLPSQKMLERCGFNIMGTYHWMLKWKD